MISKGSQCVPFYTSVEKIQFFVVINSHHSEKTMPAIGVNTASVSCLHLQQDEIEGLVRENEELKAKHLSLESRLKCLNSGGMEAAQTEDQTVDNHVLEEWATKLQLASECCEKVQQDMDKLKEVK